MDRDSETKKHGNVRDLLSTRSVLLQSAKGRDHPAMSSGRAPGHLPPWHHQVACAGTIEEDHRDLSMASFFATGGKVLLCLPPVSNTYLLTLLMVTPYPHRAPITPFVEPIAPFWIVMTCMTHRDVAGLLRPAIRYGPATGL
jgi:hypothetical protein